MKYIKLLYFFVLGLISGYISYYFVRFENLSVGSYVNPEVGTSFLSYAPGLVFGIFLLLAFFIYNQAVPHDSKHIVKYLVWIIMSAVSYWVAIQSFLHNPLLSFSFFENTGTGGLIVLLYIAGLIGSLIMLISFHYLLSPLKFIQFVILVFMGGLLGLSFGYFLGNPAEVTSLDTGLFPLYLIWQTCMATAIGFFIDWNCNHSPVVQMSSNPIS